MPLTAIITKLYKAFCAFIANFYKNYTFHLQYYKLISHQKNTAFKCSAKYRNWNLLNFVWSSIAIDASRRHHEFIANSVQQRQKKSGATCLPAEQGMQQLSGQTQQLTTWFSELKTFFGYLSPGLLTLKPTWTWKGGKKVSLRSRESAIN